MPNPSSASVERPVVLVTGAAQRLGRHIALALAERGWDVMAHYRSSEDEAHNTLDQLRDYGGHHRVAKADLANEAETRQLFERCIDEMGRVDAIVNNASLFLYDDTDTFTTEMLQKHMLPNLAAPVVLSQVFHKYLIAQGCAARGVVVNLLDQKLGNPNPDFLSYTLSKSALKTATLLMAKAMAPQLRIVGISPGLTLPSHMQTDESFNKAHRHAPLGAASAPSDITKAVVFMLESPSITGVDLVVDGGQHLLGMERDFSMMEF